MDVMCGTCGFETTTNNPDKARESHDDFDPAHEPSWYRDGDINKPVWSW